MFWKSKSLRKPFFVLLALLSILIVNAFWPVAAHDLHEKHDPDEQITMAMTAAFVSESGLDIYSQIAKYLEKKTGHKTNFLSDISYSVVNKMIEEGAADIAFVCGYPYVLLHDKQEKPTVQLLAAPVMEAPIYQNRPVYYSYIIVNKDSPAKKFEDLEGKHFVYNDEISNSGYNMPRAKLVEMGRTDGFFGQVSQSGSHEASMQWVAEGKADVSAVDSLVFDYAVNTGEAYAKKVKIIETLGPAGIPPVVGATHLTGEQTEAIKNILLHMHEDTEGKKILEKVFVKQFVAVDDSQFDDIRHMHQMAVDADFMEIQ